MPGATVAASPAAGFTRAGLTRFCRPGEPGLEGTGQRLEPVCQQMIADCREPARTRGRALMVKHIKSLSHRVPAALSELITRGRTLKQAGDDMLAYSGPARHLKGHMAPGQPAGSNQASPAGSSRLASCGPQLPLA
jgi:hypothetical protein